MNIHIPEYSGVALSILTMALFSEEEDLEYTVAAQMMMCVNAVVMEETARNKKDVPMKIDHRTAPRKPKTRWRHDEALACIKRDYLGDPFDTATPLMKDSGFLLHFRISRARFKRMFNDFKSSGFPFFRQQAQAADGTVGASLEAKLLLPLKTLAYGVPPHTFQDYFQMSATLARDCCVQFDLGIKTLYQREYLRLPTKNDLKSLSNLHKHHHGVDGMFGSLDCMHTFWKNCPKAWQGSFQGKEGKPSIVLEAIGDYNLWFWHASYGYAGTMNDLNILNASPFLQALVDGTFIEIEKSVVPYDIAGEQFQYCFILVDGIYPTYSRFVRSIPEPIGERQQRFSAWQESTRKDIERAFGVLQSKFQVLARPMLQLNLIQIGNKVATCLILHNMCVSDRVMGDVNATYDPSFRVGEVVEEEVDQPADLEAVQLRMGVGVGGGRIGVRNTPMDAQQGFTDKDRWNDLKSIEHHNRLIEALIDAQYTNKRQRK